MCSWDAVEKFRDDLTSKCSFRGKEKSHPLFFPDDTDITIIDFFCFMLYNPKWKENLGDFLSSQVNYESQYK